MLNRRAFLCGSVVTALVTRRGVEAQQVPKVPQIGVLATIRSPSTEGFLDGLRERGYIEGQNISVVWKLAEGRFEQLPTLAAELVRLNVDVIVAPSTQYAEAARRATTTIPIVFANVPDPVTIGFVQNLSKPGGNMTGVASGASATGLLGKQLELLKEMLPRLAHIGVLAKAGSPVTEERIRETRRYAAVLGIQPHVVTVAGPEEIDHAFSLMTSKRVDAVFNVPHSMFYGYRQRIVNLAAQHRLPMMCWASEFVEAGCLVSYGVNLADTVRRSAHHVDRILKGAKPSDLPVEQLTKFDFFINLKTARALGLTIPPSLLLRADQVIE